MKKMERGYVTLIETAQVGIYRADRSGTLVFVNNAMRRFAGLDEGPISMANWLSHVHPDDRDGMMEYWGPVVRDGVAGRASYRIVGPEGKVTCVLAEATPVFDNNGELDGFIGTLTDVTVERELREKAELFSRVCATLSQVNSAIIHCRDEAELFDRICTVLVEHGGLASAVVCRADWKRRKSIPVFCSGEWHDEMRRDREFDLDDPEFQTLAIMAQLSGGQVTANDIQDDERFPPRYREQVKSIGIRAGSAIAFKCFDEIVATLTLLSRDRDVFGNDIQALIEVVGRDVSFALENFAREGKRRQAEALLADKEEDLRITLRSIGDAVLATDTEGRVTLMNPVAEALTGWSDAEARGRLVNEIFHIVNEETREAVESPVAIVLRDGNVVGLANHTLLIARDGTEWPIADSGAPIRDSGDGEIRGVVLVFRDQSEERRMLAELRDSEALYSTLVNTVPVGVFRIDANGDVALSNAAIRRVWGIDADRVTIDEWLSRVHPEDRERVAENWRKAVEARAAIDESYRYFHADGDMVWVRAVAAPVPGNDGEASAYIGAAADVSSERKQRHALERMSRIYATRGQINAAIVGCENDTELLTAVSSIVVETGGFDVAMMFLRDADSGELKMTLGHKLKPGQEYVAELVDAWPDAKNTSILADIVLAEKACIVSNDYQNDPRVDLRWRKMARDKGLASVAAIPLLRSGAVVAVVNLYSRVPGVFTEDMTSLLLEVSRDVSHALDNIEHAARRRLAEAALVEREQHLRTTLRSIGDAVLATDAEGRVTLMNPVAEMLTGWREAEARGRPVSEVFHIVNEETRAPVENPIAIVLRDGNVVGLANHTLLIARDGTERPIADSGAPIRFTDDGDIQGVVLVFRDQSEEQRILKALRKSERRYSTLVKMLPAGVFESDRDGNTTYGNPTMLKLTGLDHNHAGIREWAPTVHPDDVDQVVAAWRHSSVSGKQYDIKYRYVYPDARIAWVKTIVTPLRGDGNEIESYLGVTVDITSEQEHLRRIEQLSKLYETLSQVNSAIVHCDDERELYREVAKIFVDAGGFESWTLFEYANRVQEKAKVITSFFAGDSGPSSAIATSLRDQEPGPPMTKIALATGKTQYCNDYQNDERIDSYWRGKARALGNASSAAIPFTCGDQIMAVLAFSSRERNYFTPEMIALLEQVGKDVSYALSSIAQGRQREQAEEALARNEERLRLGLRVTRTGMYESNYVTGRFTMNRIGAQLMELGDQPIDVSQETFFTMIPAEEGAQAAQAHQAILAGTVDNFLSETSRVLPDGSVRWLRNTGALTSERTAQGKPVRLMGVITDITAVKTLEEKDRLAATVFDNSGEAILIVGPDHNIVMVNNVFTRIYGYEAEEVRGTSMEAFRTDRHDDAFYQSMLDALHKEGLWQGEIWRRRKNGEVFPALVSISTVKNRKGETTHYVLQETDVTMQKAFEERISHLAYRDALTDLPNRALLRDRVEQSIASASRDHSTLALLFLDLDHFKNINDSLGHTVGDLLLKEIARRLIGSVREMDTVGRLGGDEFLVLLPEADADAAGHVAQKLLEESARTFVAGSLSLTITPSIGIAMYPKDGEDFDELLKTADTAMYRAKDEGRNAYRFYTPEMNQAVFQRMVLESSLRHAIEKGEFVLYYQPKFELRGKTLVGVEALIRWHQPEMGMISPAQFIPVAEESGLIEQIGQWVLEEACRQARIWREQCAPDICIAINFSARQFAARNVVGQITAALAEAGVPGSALEIEITESLLARDMEYTLETLQALKKIGVRAAVDDFGTGYSSLSYLKRFPIERLKIDQSFVRDLVVDADDRAIATAVVTLGHALGLRVIAEGVETAKQMDILSNMGCDEVQGYLLGRPINAAEMTQALRTYAATPSREA